MCITLLTSSINDGIRLRRLVGDVGDRVPGWKWTLIHFPPTAPAVSVPLDCKSVSAILLSLGNRLRGFGVPTVMKQPSLDSRTLTTVVTDALSFKVVWLKSTNTKRCTKLVDCVPLVQTLTQYLSPCHLVLHSLTFFGWGVGLLLCRWGCRRLLIFIVWWLKNSIIIRTSSGASIWGCGGDGGDTTVCWCDERIGEGVRGIQ